MTTDAVVARGVLTGLLAGVLADPAHPPAAGASPKLAWLKALRAEAVERVGVLTVPTLRDEAWRFTDISALTGQSFHPLRTPTSLQAGDIEHFHIKETTTRLVFVDGVHAPQLSSIGGDGGGVVVSNLSAAVATHASAIQPHLGHHAKFRDKLFSALNTAFLHDAALVIVPRETSAAEPVHLLFIATQPDVASHPRILLLAEAGSAVTLIEDYVALHDGAYFTNSVVEVALGANAKVEHVRVQRESGQAFHIASCAVSLAQASRYHSVSVEMSVKRHASSRRVGTVSTPTRSSASARSAFSHANFGDAPAAGGCAGSASTPASRSFRTPRATTASVVIGHPWRCALSRQAGIRP